jgi:mRNA-degrading endonuclease toxin of MazEF toxin-antitoxin module
MCDLAFASSVQLRAAREVTRLRFAIPHRHAISGVILVDQVRSLSWEKRYVKMAGAATIELLNEVRERLAVLLEID